MFKLNDEVWSVNYGWGVVVETDDTGIPIGVEFKCKKETIIWYYANGKRSEEEQRTLFFEEFEIPKSALERPRKSAKEMLDECEQLKFETGEDNFYICYNHISKTFYISRSIFIECLGIKYISEEDAERIIKECKENN